MKSLHFLVPHEDLPKVRSEHIVNEDQIVQIVRQWAESAESRWPLTIRYVEGKVEDPPENSHPLYTVIDSLGAEHKSVYATPETRARIHQLWQEATS